MAPARPRAVFVSAAPLVAIAALAVPAMLVGGTETHSHGSATADAANADESQSHTHDTEATAGPTTTFDEGRPHTHDANGSSVALASATTIDESQLHSHEATTTTAAPGQLAADGTPVRPWPRAWDPSQPIDVGGVAGVSTAQEARAEALIQGTLTDLPKYADTAAAVADGYTSIGDAGTGSEHYINNSLIQDDALLDPTAPESLVYDVGADGTRTLVGAMYIASARPADDPSLTEWAGPLMTWHVHNNLCWGVGADGKPKVVGLTDADGKCAQGVQTGGENPMVHVWIVPRDCGVFSALDGVGAGNAAPSVSERTDQCSTAGPDHGGNVG